MTISCENSRRGVAYVVLLGLLLSGIDHVSSSCDWTGLASCSSILTAIGGDTLGSGMSSMPNATQLTYLCSFMRKYESCYKPKSAGCQSNDLYKLSFGTIEKTFRYICVDGKEDLIRYNWCWVKDDVTKARTKCQNTMKAESAYIKRNAVRLGLSEIYRRTCVSVKSTKKCMKEAVGGKCGDGPSCVMQRMMDKALENLAVYAKCSSPASTCRVPANGTDIIEPATTEILTTRRSTKNPYRATKSPINESSTCHSGFMLVILITLFATFLAV